MSAPGASEAATCTRASGFTLLEMLVVVMVMGLLLGLVAANTAPDARATLALEAERLARLLDLAASETRFAGRPIAWTSDGAGYRFWRRNDAGLWSEISDSDSLRARTLPSGLQLDGLRLEAGKAVEPMRLEFSAGALLPVFDIDLAMGQEHFHVTGSPVGEMSALPGRGRNVGD